MSKAEINKMCQTYSRCMRCMPAYTVFVMSLVPTPMLHILNGHMSLRKVQKPCLPPSVSALKVNYCSDQETHHGPLESVKPQAIESIDNS